MKGAQEIDRQKMVIKRILGAINSLIKKIDIRKKHWKYREVILEIPFDELFFQLSCSKRDLSMEILNKNRDDNLWWATENNADRIPVWAVPIIYNNLSDIVSKLDKFLPEAGIFEHFQFFMRQAKS